MTRKTSRRRLTRAGRGSVILLTVLLIGSSLLRIGSGMGAAFASDAPAEEMAPKGGAAHKSENGRAADTHQTDEQQRSGGHSEGTLPARSRLSRSKMADLLEALNAREAQLESRELQINRRAKALKVADQEIERRLVALKDAEAALRATLALADTAAEDDLSRLTAVYENMKPKDAAALFEKMDPGFAAGFLGRMRADAAAAVLAGLSPDKAYSVSVILAGRNATVPKT